MKRRLRSLFVLLLIAIVPLCTAAGQSPRTIAIQVDNDAFDFWMAPWDRPDEEYTSGVRISYEGGDAPWWIRRFSSHLRECTAHVSECRSGALTLGQDMYTPHRSADSPVADPGSRSNAGWLYLRQSGSIISTNRADEFSLTLGVTGPPSLAQVTQRLAHAAAPAFNRPIDWTTQVEFEPGVIARYEQRRRWGAREMGPIGIDVVPHASINVGNISSEVETGVRLRIGYHLRHPWMLASGRAPTEVAITTGVSVRGVARDVFLDGNTFRNTPGIGHEPVVQQADLMLRLQHRWLMVAYGATTQSRAYKNGTAWHPWGSLIGAVTFDR